MLGEGGREAGKKRAERGGGREERDVSLPAQRWSYRGSA